jgi:branched-chain amino acid transport system permease protein
MGHRGLVLRAGAILLAAYAILALAGPGFLDAGWQSLLYLTLYYVCLTAAWNFFSGFSGYINFGFVAFIGVGMYATVIALVDYGAALWVGYLIGGLGAAIFAALIGYPVLRIRGAYFSIAMLAVAEGARILFGTEYLEPFTRGGRGFPVLAGTLHQQYYAMLVLAVVIVGASFWFARSRFGLALIAVREDEAAAEGLGVNTTAVKVAAFVISAFFAGVAGGIHATFVHYIDPTAAFDMKYTVLPIIMAIFGGLGTVLGPVIGAVGLEVVSDFAWLYLGRLNVTIFGLILIALVLWLPDGLLVRLKDIGILPKTRAI